MPALLRKGTRACPAAPRAPLLRPTPSLLSPHPPPAHTTPTQVFQFCRAKCHRAFSKKRNPRKVKWTKASRKAGGKDLKVDATFEFEKRRNRPVRYDRDLMAATISAMKRVSEIQQAREGRFYEKRFKGVKALERAKRRQVVERHIDLAKPAAARKRVERTAAEKARVADTRMLEE